MCAPHALIHCSKSTALSVLAAGFLALISSPSPAATVASSAMLAAAPLTSGTGLNGAYFNTSAGFNNNTEADSYLGSHSATASFHSTQPSYNSGANNNSVVDSTSLGTFLGADAGGLSNSVRASTLDTSLFRFTGYIKISQDMDTQSGNGTIDVKFRGWSDDGMRLKIGGVTIDEYNAPRAYGFSDGVASFSQAGLYAIDFIYWENYGNTGVNLQWQIGRSGNYRTVDSSYLYSTLPVAAMAADRQVPEPAGFGLLALGLLGLSRLRKQA